MVEISNIKSIFGELSMTVCIDRKTIFDMVVDDETFEILDVPPEHEIAALIWGVPTLRLKYTGEEEFVAAFYY